MTDYNDGNWHGWDGGECPVHPMTEVEVLFPNGSRKYVPSQDCSPAWDLAWNATPCLFRVTKEYREPREFWIAGDHWCASKAEAKSLNCLHSKPDREITHVREVLE